jgi:hypothetical protein
MDTLDAAGLPHQADSPYFPLALAQSPSHLDVVFAQEPFPCREILDSLGGDKQKLAWAIDILEIQTLPQIDGIRRYFPDPIIKRPAKLSGPFSYPHTYGFLKV